MTIIINLTQIILVALCFVRQQDTINVEACFDFCTGRGSMPLPPLMAHPVDSGLEFSNLDVEGSIPSWATYDLWV